MTIRVYLLLLACFLHLATPAPLLLTPPFPPTAFVGQPYQTRFQASGLIKPTFSFEQLPSFLKGFPNGTVAGTPEETGSYKITVKYTDKTHNGSAEAVISVGSNSTDNINLSPYASTPTSPLYISTSGSNWIFQAGDPIQIGFQCINAVEPTIASYTNLPPGLTGDNTAIEGTISTPGLYTFALLIGDAQGYRAQTFFTINIQPKNTNSNQTISDVTVNSIPYDFDQTALQAAQTASANTAKNALQKAITAKNNLAMIQNSLYSTANTLVLAQQASLFSQQSYTDALQNLNSLQTYINNGATAIQALTTRKSVATTALTQANTTLADALIAYNISSAVFQNQSEIFNNSVSEMTKASKASSEAQTQYNLLAAAATSANNAFNACAANLEVMKQNRDSAQAMLNDANRVVPTVQLIKDMSSQDNDAATANFNTAVSNIQITQSNLQKVNTYVQEGTAALEQAKRDLGTAQFNLIQANNNLFVAQAAKQVADKAIAIIIAQGFGEIVGSSSSTTASSSSTGVVPSSFRGCDNYAYPSMFGTQTISELLPDGARTTGRHKLAWGNCTKKSSVRVGDQIYYEGSLIENTISLWLLVNLSI